MCLPYLNLSEHMSIVTVNLYITTKLTRPSESAYQIPKVIILWPGLYPYGCNLLDSMSPDCDKSWGSKSLSFSDGEGNKDYDQH